MSGIRLRDVSLVLTLAVMVAACEDGGQDTASDVLDDLPEGTAAVSVVDVEAMATSHELELGELGLIADVRLDVIADNDRSDPRALLVAELSAVIPPWNLPFDNAHLEAIEVGPIDSVVNLPTGGLVVISTEQDPDQLSDAYAEAGFEAVDDGRYLHPGEAEPDDSSGGFPAVSVEDGRLVLARSLDILDGPASGDGVASSARALLDAAEDAWAIDVRADSDLEPDVCGAGQALARTEDGAQFLVLGGGDDVIEPGSWELFSGELGAAEIDEHVSRYAIELDPSEHHHSLLGAAPEIPSLARC